MIAAVLSDLADDLSSSETSCVRICIVDKVSLISVSLASGKYRSSRTAQVCVIPHLWRQAFKFRRNCRSRAAEAVSLQVTQCSSGALEAATLTSCRRHPVSRTRPLAADRQTAQRPTWSQPRQANVNTGSTPSQLPAFSEFFDDLRGLVMIKTILPAQLDCQINIVL